MWPINLEKNQLIESDPEMTEMMEFADKENMNTVMMKMEDMRKNQTSRDEKYNILNEKCIGWN